MVLLVRCERIKESINCFWGAVGGNHRFDPEAAVPDAQRLIGKEYVKMIWFRPLVVGDGDNGHLCVALDDLRKEALVIRRKVRDKNERHPGVWVKVFKDL